MTRDATSPAVRLCCDLWKPVEEILPSEWAGRHRVLPPSVSAEPGPWRNSRTPYLVGIMDAMTEPGVEGVVFLKPVQIGGSEAFRNCLGYWIDCDPGPCLYVLPDEQTAKEIAVERVKPLIEESPRLLRHKSGRPWDSKTTGINLDTMPIYMAWAGSAQRLASRPIRYLLKDEVDKYPPFVGREGDPMALADERTTTYGHRRVIMEVSTPTTRHGNIWRAWESCADQRRFWVPCPHCGAFQILNWAQVKWPKIDEEDNVKKADRVELGDLAWYECEHCQAQIRDQHKPLVLSRGVWASEDQIVNAAGEIKGPRPASKRVGFHLNSLYSPWVRISSIVAEFIRATGDAAKMMSWRNNKLAEPFEEQASSTKPGVIEAKMAHAGPPLVVPKWAGMLLAQADVQKDHIFFCIRAWGHAYRSQLIEYGLVSDFDELYTRIFERPLQSLSEGAVLAAVLGVDCKYRSKDVYQFAQRDPARIWPTAGAAQSNAPPITERSVKGYEGVIRRMVNPNYWKDTLHGYIHSDDPTQWLPHDQIGDDYVRQMTSEHKVYDPRGNVWTWVPMSQGIPNHWWDCEYNLCMLAQLCGAAMLPASEAVPSPGRAADDPSDNPIAQVESDSSWATEHKGRWS